LSWSEGGGRWVVVTGLCAGGRAVTRDGVAEMPGDRLHRIVAAFSAGGDVWSSAWLCGVCPGIAGVTGAGVMLMSGEIPRGSLCCSNEVSQLVKGLQYPLGEGPCVDAYQQDRVVAEPDLADPGTRRRLAFPPPALQAGGRAVVRRPRPGGRAGGVRAPAAVRHGTPGAAQPLPGLPRPFERRSAR